MFQPDLRFQFLLLFLFSFIPFSESQSNVNDKNILVNFYNGLTSKGHLSWNTAISLCGQTGVYCDGTNTNVTQLDLGGNQLTGTIPTQLGNLYSLIYLFLDTNQLTGTIPTQLGNLNSLTQLYLFGNQLTGTIPTALHSHQYSQLYLINYGSPGGNNFCPLVSFSSWATDNDSPTSLTCQACAWFTCQNGGTCSGGVNQLFNCTCINGFTGDNCELTPSTPTPTPTPTPTTTTIVVIINTQGLESAGTKGKVYIGIVGTIATVDRLLSATGIAKGSHSFTITGLIVGDVTEIILNTYSSDDLAVQSVEVTQGTTTLQSDQPATTLNGNPIYFSLSS